MRKTSSKITLEGLSGKFDQLAAQMLQGFKQVQNGFKRVNKNFAEMAVMINSAFQEKEDMDAKRFKNIDVRFEEVNHRFEQVDMRFSSLDRRVDQIAEDVGDIKKEIRPIKTQQAKLSKRVLAVEYASGIKKP
jgi:septal ring factor EnvC (AmiA/AmiB activator)